MSHRIFLSHSSRDRALASALGRELKKLGVTPFDPFDFKVGSDWRKNVTDAIGKSDMVAVLLTQPSTVALSWIGFDLGFASALGKEVVVLKPSSFSVSDFPSDLAGWRMLDFDPRAPKQAAKALASSLALAA